MKKSDALEAMKMVDEMFIDGAHDTQVDIVKMSNINICVHRDDSLGEFLSLTKCDC